MHLSGTPSTLTCKALRIGRSFRTAVGCRKMGAFMRALVLAVSCCALAVSGCATKRYGRLQPLTVAEQQAYDCRQLDIEIAKVEAFREQVANGAEFNLASVAGFLGDWGIGNSMERNDADKSATQRMNDLLAARAVARCGQNSLSKDEVTAIEAKVEEEQIAPPPVRSDGLNEGARVQCITCRPN